MIRHASLKDVRRLVEITKQGHADSMHSHIPFSEDDTTVTYQRLVNGKWNCLLVYEVNGVIEGLLGSTANKVFCSRANYKECADLIFYMTEKGKGYGSRLLIKYIAHMRNLGITNIWLGSSAGGNSERLFNLYETLGAVKVGGLYLIQNIKDKDEEAA